MVLLVLPRACEATKTTVVLQTDDQQQFAAAVSVGQLAVSVGRVEVSVGPLHVSAAID